MSQNWIWALGIWDKYRDLNVDDFGDFEFSIFWTIGIFDFLILVIIISDPDWSIMDGAWMRDDATHATFWLVQNFLNQEEKRISFLYTKH